MKRRPFLAALPALWAASAAGAAAPRWRPFVADSEAALRRAEAGRPFVLAFWSVHCPPCRDELPHWARLAARHPALRVGLVCTDYGDDLDLAASVAPAVAGRLEHWAFADEVPERLRWRVDPGWRGELPMARVYDRAHRVEVRRGRLDVAELDRLLHRLAGSRS